MLLCWTRYRFFFFYKQKTAYEMRISDWSSDVCSSDRGAEAALIHWTVVQSSLGPMLIAATEKGLCRISFDEDESDLRRRFPKADIRAGDASLDRKRVV